VKKVLSYLNTNKKWIYLALFVLFSGVIIYFSVASGEDSSAQSGFFVNLFTSFLKLFNVELDQAGIDLTGVLIRKIIGHFGLFMVDAIFGYLALLEFKLLKKQYIGLIVIIVMMMMLAFGSEGLQLIAEERGGSLLDVALDMLGALLGILIVHLCYFYKLKRSDEQSTLKEEGNA
jgi:VanZ family protein